MLSGRTAKDNKKYGPLAHLVEHLTLNQGVRGSSPRRPTNLDLTMNNHGWAHFFMQKNSRV